MVVFLGIDVDCMIFIIFVMGVVFVVVVGMMFFMYYGVIVFIDGFVLGVKVFIVVVFGGIGLLLGVVIGGLLIGFIELFWLVYFMIVYKDVVIFVILVFVLIFKLFGFLGCLEVEKVWFDGNCV